MLLEKTEPFEPRYGTIIGYVDVLDHMHLEMDMIIHSFPSNDWGNILQVGIQNGDRYPILMIHPESDNSGHPNKGFYVVVKDGSGLPAYGGSMGDALVRNQQYHIELDFTQTRFTVVVNGETLFDDIKTEHTHQKDMPCYSGFPVHSAADVTVSNLIMWSSDLFPVLTPKPTTAEPTAEPETAEPTTSEPTIQRTSISNTLFLIGLNFEC